MLTDAELNARVAEEVFGLPVVVYKRYESPVYDWNHHSAILEPHWVHFDEGEVQRAFIDLDRRSRVVANIPDYVGRWGDAQQVIDWLLARSEDQNFHLEHLHGEWSVLTRPGDQWWHDRVTAEQPRRAICFASLQAVRKDKGE